MFRIGNNKQCRFIFLNFFVTFSWCPPSWLPSIRVFTVLSVGTLVVAKPKSFFCRFCSPVALRYLVLTKLNSKLTPARLTLSPTFPYTFQNNIPRKSLFTTSNKTFFDCWFFAGTHLKRHCHDIFMFHYLNTTQPVTDVLMPFWMWL